MRSTTLLLALLCLGCGTKQAATTVIPLTEVAPEVMQAAQQALPKVKFASARRVQINGEECWRFAARCLAEKSEKSRSRRRAASSGSSRAPLGDCALHFLILRGGNFQDRPAGHE